MPEFVRERLAAAIEKHFDGEAEGHVIFAHDGAGYRADCTVHLSAGVMLKSHAVGNDPRVAFDEALEHLEKQVRRYKRRLKNHHERARTRKGAIEQQ